MTTLGVTTKNCRLGSVPPNRNGVSSPSEELGRCIHGGIVLVATPKTCRSFWRPVK
jgi:hypothetical protein